MKKVESAFGNHDVLPGRRPQLIMTGRASHEKLYEC